MASYAPLPHVEIDAGQPPPRSLLSTEAETGPAPLDGLLNGLLSLQTNMRERAIITFLAVALNMERAPQLLQPTELRLVPLCLLLLLLLLC